MKKGLVEALVVAVALCFVGVAICGAQELTVGYVDLQKLMVGSKRAKDGMQKLQAMAAQKKAEFEKKVNELKALREELEKQGAMLKEDTRVEKMRQAQYLEIDLSNLKRESEGALQNAERDWQESFQRDMKKVIDKYRAQKKLTIVLSSMGVISVDPVLDITDDVIGLLDADPGSAAQPKPTPGPKPAPPVHKPAPGAKPPAPAPGR